MVADRNVGLQSDEFEMESEREEYGSGNFISDGQGSGSREA